MRLRRRTAGELHDASSLTFFYVLEQCRFSLGYLTVFCDRPSPGSNSVYAVGSDRDWLRANGGREGVLLVLPRVQVFLNVVK